MKKTAVAVCTALALLVGCKSSTQEGATHTTRKQLLLVSDAMVSQQAAQAYRQELVKANRAHRLNTGPEAERVYNIAKRLIAQVAVFKPEATKWKWEVNTIDNKEVNAYCMPGGKIVVFTGIINTLKLTDDELAAVIGHEITHALREHGREKVSQQLLAQGAITVVGAVTQSRVKTGMAAMVGQYLFALPFSRTMETESDIMGLELMARAGFNPEAAPNVWRKMAQLSQQKPPEFLSTHPSDKTRIADLEKALPLVKPLYEAAVKQG